MYQSDAGPWRNYIIARLKHQKSVWRLEVAILGIVVALERLGAYSRLRVALRVLEVLTSMRTAPIVDL